jgi:hypothetical protein
MIRNRIQAGRAIADQRAFDRKLSALFAASLPRKAMARGARFGADQKGEHA